MRGLPWLGRTLRTFGGGSNSLAVIRTAVISVLALLVFGVLFASGDAIFGHWVSAVLPDVQGALLLRIFVMLAVAGTVLAAAYLSLNPPSVNVPTVHRPAQHRFEWLAPVLLVDAVFVVFLAAQAAAFFGGHRYIQQATGLTYADYVHQGFAQLTIATVLTLLVVWAASRKAGIVAADRWWLRGSLGALCVLTLVVVASALHRMDLYQDAYGFTRLRLLVDLFEGWLGLVVVAVMVAGIGLRGWWLPRMALLSGSALLLGLGIANPDAWIAEHNVERYQATGKVDYSYLRSLSLDAAPALVDLPPEAGCLRSRRHLADRGLLGRLEPRPCPCHRRSRHVRAATRGRLQRESPAAAMSGPGRPTAYADGRGGHGTRERCPAGRVARRRGGRGRRTGRSSSSMRWPGACSAARPRRGSICAT